MNTDNSSLANMDQGISTSFKHTQWILEILKMLRKGKIVFHREGHTKWFFKTKGSALRTYKKVTFSDWEVLQLYI